MNDDNKSDSEQDPQRQEYLQHRNYLIATSIDQMGQFDKLIVTLSGGALALSLTFIKDISPNPIPCSKWLIFGAWGFFTISLVSVLLSHLTSHKDMEFEIDKLDDNYKNQEENYNPKNPFKKTTIFLNRLSTVTFLLGLFFLVTFASINFLK